MWYSTSLLLLHAGTEAVLRRPPVHTFIAATGATQPSILCGMLKSMSAFEWLILNGDDDHHAAYMMICM